MEGREERPLLQVDVRSLLFRTLRNWYLFPLCLFLTLSIAFLYLRYTHPVFLVETDILNRATAEEQISSSLFGELAATTAITQNLVEDEIQVLKSRNLLEEVVKTLQLEVQYFSRGRVQDFDLYPYIKRSPILVEPVWPFEEAKRAPDFVLTFTGDETYQLEEKERVYQGTFGQLISTHQGSMVINRNPLAEESLAEVQFNIKSATSRAEEYGRDLTVAKAGRETNALNIALLETVPRRGVDFLRQMVAFYDQSIVAEKGQIAEKTITFLDQRLAYLEEELDLSAANSEDYIVKNDLIEGVENKLAYQVETLREYDQQLAVVAIQLENLDSLRQLLNNPQALDKLAAFDYSPYVVNVNGTDYSSLISQYAELLLQREELELGATGKHPVLGPLQERIGALQQYLNQELSTARRELDRTRERLQTRTDSLFRAMRAIPRYQREVEGLERVLDIKEQLYVELLKKKEENTLSRAAALSELKILKDPSLSAKVSPDEPRIYALLALVGLLLPAALITVREVFDNTVKTPEQIKKLTDAPLVGSIAASRDKDVIVVTPQRRSGIVEMFRMLRTNLNYVGRDGNIPQRMLITSTVSGEGKTFITINLGLSLAISNKRVCLVNLDLRKPRLGNYLGINENQNGLSSYLIGETEYNQLMQQWEGNENLYFIPSGPLPPNPGELLLSPKLDQLFERLQKEYDYIVIDAPPVGLVSDALSLGRLAELTLFVIRFNYSTTRSLELISDLKRAGKLPHPAVVFNGVQATRGYGYGYSYGYGYGYGYGGYGQGYYDDEEQFSLWHRLTGK